MPLGRPPTTAGLTALHCPLVGLRGENREKGKYGKRGGSKGE